MTSEFQFLSDVPWAKMLPALGTVSLVVLLFFKTGSIHIVVDHLWRRLAGRAQTLDPRLRTAIRQTNDREEIRFRYGIKVTNNGGQKRLLDFTQEYDVGMEELQACKSHFDVERDEMLKIPGKYARRLVKLCLLLFSILTAMLLYVSTSPVVWATDKSNGHQFFFTPTQVERLSFSEHFLLPKDRCDADPAILSDGRQEVEADVQKICSAVKEGKYSEFVREKGFIQRVIGAIFLATFAGPFTLMFKLQHRGILAALKVKARMDLKDQQRAKTKESPPRAASLDAVEE